MKQIVSERDDIVFFVKLFPLVNIHPDAYRKSQAIMCEKDNEKALELLEDAFEKREVPGPVCQSDVIDKNLQLGRSLGVTGTPALIFQNGKLVSGAIIGEEIIEKATSSGKKN
jgi:thiol:disulfide interchange protein DsbC